MDNDPVTYFSQLPEAECRSLLGEVEYGRVAWCSDEGVTVLPVNFQLVDGHVVFHTAPGTMLSSIAEGAEVAFQIDDIDAEAANGWTVLLHGTTAPAPEQSAQVSWLGGDRPLGIMIQERSLTGRALSGTKRG